MVSLNHPASGNTNWYSSVDSNWTTIETAFIENGLLTTKGDIVARSSTAPVRKAVGTDNAILMADSSQSDGLKYVGMKHLFSATRTAAQTISNATFTKIQFNSEEVDLGNEDDPTTNYRFTPTQAGYYLVSMTIYYNTTMATDTLQQLRLYKNGSSYSERDLKNTGYESFQLVEVLFMNGTTDYIEGYTYQSSGGNADVYFGHGLCVFQALLLPNGAV